MPITINELEGIIQAPSETEVLEFKEAKNNYDLEKLIDYCVALGNAGGGKIILGVTDKLPRKVTGSSACKRPARTVASIHERLRIKVDFQEINHPDGRVLIFNIPSRSIGQPLHNNGRYLMRVGDSLTAMSPDQLAEIVNEGKPDWLQQYALENCSSEDVIKLLDTQSYFDLLNIPYPSNRDGVLEKFLTERLIAKAGDNLAITNLGAVTFAKRLGEFPLLDLKAPRLIVYAGNNKLDTKLDKPGTKGYAVGFQGLVEFINSQIPTNEVVTDALRKEIKMFPSEAIRELVANALVHQDFNETGASVRIELYSDRIDISNPGLPEIPLERFIDEYKSRNESLADLMRRLGVCEAKGSGIDRVIFNAELYQLPAPNIHVGNVMTGVTMYAHKDFKNMDRTERIRACYQHCCLRHVMNEKMTNQTLRERFNLPETKTESISRVIRDTLDAERIKPADPSVTSTRYRSYIPDWA
jgi:ATP-dependent DNA helicase RecG